MAFALEAYQPNAKTKRRIDFDNVGTRDATVPTEMLLLAALQRLSASHQASMDTGNPLLPRRECDPLVVVVAVCNA